MLDVSYSPSSSSGIDDAVEITGRLNDIAGKGKLWIVPNLSGNAFAIKTPIVPPSKSLIELHPACVLGSTMSNTGSGGYTNSVFYATKSNVGSSNNLHTDAIRGSNKITVTSSVAAGSLIALAFTLGGNQQQLARVLKCTANAGYYDLILDQVVRHAYWTVANGAYVYTLTSPSDITIIANGASIFGTGDRALELAFAWNCHVSGFNVDQTLGGGVDGFKGIIMSLDIGCNGCSLSKCRVDGGGGYLSGVTAGAGFGSESNSRCRFHDLVAMNLTTAGTTAGLTILDSTNCDYDAICTTNCLEGVYVGSNDTHGTEGARGVRIRGLKTELCSTASLQADKTSTVSVEGWDDVGAACSVSQLDAAKVHVSHFNWQAQVAGTYNGWNAVFGELHLADGVIDMTSTSGTKAVCDWGSSSAGTLQMSRVNTIGGTYGLYLEDSIAHRVIIDDTCDFSSCTTPFRKGTSSKLSFGTLTANGTTPVTPPGIACTAKDSVRLIQTSGTPTTPPALTSIGTDTFTVVALLGNNNTYDWRIVRGGP